jgi:uncharacterized protein (DUF342 family)
MADIEKDNLETRIKIEIAERNMKAFLEIKAPEAEDTVQITSQNIMDLLAKAGIVFGINSNLIDEIVNGKKWGEKFVVAEGIQPQPGEDAKFEFTFPTDKSFKPQIKEDGHIDYHELSIVNSVVKDGVLIKKIPAAEGARGRTVLGDILPSVAGKDANIQIGPGAYKDPSDSKIIKASVDGIIFYDAKTNHIEVQKLYMIKDSVDYSTGNINVKSSVEIKGDVKPGFSVKTPYDIQINGNVEQAVLSCEGTLKVNKGIVGDGKQSVYAGCDIHAGYINNLTVKCKGSLYVSTEIRNSNVECGGEVILVKGEGTILGGKVFATNKLTSAVIGNRYNVPTEIEVGIPLELKDKHDLKKAEIAACRKTISNFNKNIAELSEQKSNEAIDQKIATLREESDAALLHLDTLKKDILELEKQGSGKDAPVVVVTKTVYPGTVIKIRHACYEVKEELSHVKFAIVSDEITYTKIQ